jgi:LacI family transcriptional regulator
VSKAKSDERPTLKTIAQISGLAITTVSRALKDAPDLSKNTKKRVKQIAKEIGYVPDRAGIRLRTGKSQVIAVVLSTSENISDLIGELISHITHAIAHTSYHIVVTPELPSQNRMDPIEYLVQNQAADAVIFDRTEVDDERVAYLLENKMPFATFGRTQWSAQHAYFDFDNYDFGCHAANKLLQQGRRSLLMVAPPEKHQYTQHLVEGAKRVAVANQAQFNILPNANNDDSEQKITTALEDYLREYPMTDGIICSSTMASVSAIKCIDKLNRSLGGDIDLYTKNSSPYLSYFRPQIFTAKEDVELAGTFLAEAVIHAIEHPDEPPMQRVESAQFS